MILALLACTRPTPPATPELEPEVPVATGVTRAYTWDVGYGAWDLWLNGEQVVGRATGFTLDGASWGPTIVCDLGDTVRLTLNNLTNEPVGLTPGGLRYDGDNDGLRRLALPGRSATWTWEAMEGPGVFLYRSRVMDTRLREHQAMSGLLGLIVVRGRDWRDDEPDRLLNALLVRTYPPNTTVQDGVPGPWRHPGGDTACPQCVDTGLPDLDRHGTHNQALVLQEVRENPAGTGARNPWLTTTHTVPRVELAVGEAVRLHAVAYGTQDASLHVEGLTWPDPFTGQLLTTRRLGPGETTWADFGELNHAAIGAHRIENFSTHDYGLMSGWLVVSVPTP